MSIAILAIESSCDDTAAAVVLDGQVRSNIVSSQEVHRLYGGVVPELASRAHQEYIVPVVQLALEKAGISARELSAVAFTRGPGLMGSLLVGLSFAKGLALSLQIPLIEVHHMQAHILAHFIEDPQPNFPFLCLTVSGGHTQIVVVRDYLDMELIGQTLDDAAGEAFDKTGKMLGLPYPAGPEIDRLAQKGQPCFAFPEPSVPGLDFSFSGLKTSIRNFLLKAETATPGFKTDRLPDICASVQHSIVGILLHKLELAADHTGIREVAIAGGVSANSELRKQLIQLGKKKQWEVHIPKMAYSTDNAAMIGITAHYKFQMGLFAPQSVEPLARWHL